MIDHLIERLVIVYPTEMSTAADMLALTWPALLICAIVWLAAVIGEALIDWVEVRRIERTKRPHYRTANARQIQRETEQLWRRTPDAKGASWEPWRDTMPPAEPAAPRHRVRAGSPTVVPFPPANAERRRQP